ncbi:MAG TPA: FAD-dependent oxidoreductase [Tepidisphaeraceae bacterium]|nr:FAD-dependent oxidoreductase [Tepidisphaeraceae bacterium]
MATREMKTQILIVGGGTGGVAAALAALAGGARVVLTEATSWIGGQFTSQFVPPDENAWIETTGGTRRYRALREGIRNWYRTNRSLTEEARNNPKLNPGGGHVSQISHEPKVSLAVMEKMLAPYRDKGVLTLLLQHVPIGAGVDRDRVKAVTLRDLETGNELVVEAEYILDATELGDLLPLTGAEYVTGAESRGETGEPHAVEGEARTDDVQAFTWCLPMGWDGRAGAEHVIEKPGQWERWRDYVPRLAPAWPGRLVDWVFSQPQSLKPIKSVLFWEGIQAGEFCLWNYRKVVTPEIYEGRKVDEVSVMNWPQNDYWLGNVIDAPAEKVAVYLEEARQLSLSVMYWLQTVAGYRGLYLRPDLTGTKDGLAMAPYYRESRRIKALFTVTEHHVGVYARYQHEQVDVMKLPAGVQAERFGDSVGIGYYRIDLHPSTGGRNYIDIASLPFQIPLGALVPERMENLLAACKNIGTTHITNGCYRLHPVEWNIGESAGALAAFCLARGWTPRQVREKKECLREFQELLVRDGVRLAWD